MFLLHVSRDRLFSLDMFREVLFFLHVSGNIVFTMSSERDLFYYRCQGWDFLLCVWGKDCFYCWWMRRYWFFFFFFFRCMGRDTFYCRCMGRDPFHYMCKERDSFYYWCLERNLFLLQVSGERLFFENFRKRCCTVNRYMPLVTFKMRFQNYKYFT